MNVWGALAGGFIGTLVLTTALRTANELGLTRIDLPFLLGTAVTRDRARAKALGYLMHLAAGELFALAYYAIFAATETSGWALGALLGLLHGIVSATALVNILLPAVHPRMGNELTAANSSPLLEPPGFLLRKFKYAVLISFVVAAIITPTPDVATQTLLAVPMLGLYLLGVLVAWVFGRPRRSGETVSAEA